MIKAEHIMVSSENFSAGINITLAKPEKGKKGDKGYVAAKPEKRSFFASFGTGVTWDKNAQGMLEGVAATCEELADTENPRETLLLLAGHLRTEASAAATSGEHARFLTDEEPALQNESPARMKRWYKGGQSLYLSSAAASADAILP